MIRRHCCVGGSLAASGRWAAYFRTDCHSELVEDGAEPVARGDVGGDLVVVAAQVLHEGVTSGENPR